jgi:hypothetical protein
MREVSHADRCGGSGVHPIFSETDRVTQVRLAEVSAAISLFTDIATGQPQEHALRTCVVAMRLADYWRWTTRIGWSGTTPACCVSSAAPLTQPRPLSSAAEMI